MNIIRIHSRYLISIFIMLIAISLSACFDGSSSNSNNSQNPDEDNGLAVTSTSPAAGALGVATNSRVTATLSEAINADTFDIDSFTVGVAGETPVTGTVKFDATTNTGTFESADGGFSAGATYTATITTVVESLDGKALADAFQWTFTTSEDDDNTAPAVTSTDPDNNATDVAINRNISASFSESVYVPSVNSATFTVTDGDTDTVTGTVQVIGTTAVFNPAANLATGTEYTATLTTGVTDLADNALAADVSWSFTTGENIAEGPAPVVLGSAGNYVILAKTGISTTGTTKITGDIAVSPAAETAITDFGQARDASDTFSTAEDIVTGKIFAADMAVPTPSVLTTAISDMELAYTDAVGRSNPDTTELGAGDISGLTLSPGLYKWSSGLLIDSDVTLSGDANDVWILQIAGDLTVGNGVAVTLIGGALPKNVFWQIASEVTFGTTSDVRGIVLSKTLIAIKTGAALNGRALAQTAVTLDANAVTQPVQ